MEKNILPRFNPFDASEWRPQLTPDTEQFRNIPINVAVLTKYGRSIWILHGNEDRCSSFFATIGTIVNKLQLSFGKATAEDSKVQPSKLKCIRQVKTRGGKPEKFDIFALKRKNFLYICWTNSALKVSYHEMTLLTMIDFLHYQLSSCLTQKVNDILQQNQTYDPSINFGKGRAMQNLLHYAVQNGLQSVPILFDAIPILPLTLNTRNAILSLLKDHKEDGLQMNLIITMSHVVAIHKRKNLDLHMRDLLIFFNLIQTQSSLCKSENWFPICLPGVEAHSMVFCYLNFLAQQIIHIMIADESDIFPVLSELSKEIKRKLVETGTVDKINSAVKRQLITDPSLERMNLVKHFIVKQHNPSEMIMSNGQYFGKQLEQSRFSQDQFRVYLNIYGQLYQHLLSRKSNRKENLHVQSFYIGKCCLHKGPISNKNKNEDLSMNAEEMGPRQSIMDEGTCVCKLQTQFLGGYYSEGTYSIFFIASAIAELEDAKSIIASILKFAREDENGLFIAKLN